MERVDRIMLDRAARLAWRGWGDVEPNPMVGCVIARLSPGARRDDAAAWQTVGLGHHRRFGGAHAEVEALEDCRRRGRPTRGATAWVTLEPCRHWGKTPPCVGALVEAGIAEVVTARLDPGAESGGGLEALARVGVTARLSAASPAATAVSDPFIKRATTGLPWVIAKWAQTPEGRLTLDNGERWISGEASRRRVHRLRSRVDAVITGSGTALADNPLLTARPPGGRRPRRSPIRVILDSHARLPIASALARTAGASRVVVMATHSAGDKGLSLRSAGVEVLELPAGPDGRVDLREALEALADGGATTALVEAGPTLLRAFFEAGLIDEAWAFVAGCEPAGAGAAAAAVAPDLADEGRWRRVALRRIGEDALAVWRAVQSAGSASAGNDSAS